MGGTGETAKKNRETFYKWSIVPRRLIRTGVLPNLSTHVVGHCLQFPMALAPVGVQHGEEATARAAAKQNVPFIMSTASSTSIEDVPKANGDGVRWFQLYWPQNEHNEITVSLLTRAKNAGFTALVVTLDTYILGWRPSDMDNGYKPFRPSRQIDAAIDFSDPGLCQQFQAQHGVEVEDLRTAAAEWTRIVFPGMGHGREDIEFLQKHWEGPIILKGIQTVDDAKHCARLGIQGIVVSNHGGRQVDGGVASLAMLPKIVDAVGDKLDVMFESGTRCGADIAKAIALGAKLCSVGRPYIYGLALGGELGVDHVIRSLLGDL